MSSINEREYSACYEQGVLVFEEKKTLDDAVRVLSNPKGLNMNKNSAKYYVNAYLNMRYGKTYRRTINNDALWYFLKHISAENGHEALQLALIALQKHLCFYSKQDNGRLALQQNIYDYFMKKLYDCGSLT